MQQLQLAVAHAIKLLGPLSNGGLYLDKYAARVVHFGCMSFMT